jgi:hypothetical protein
VWESLTSHAVMAYIRLPSSTPTPAPASTQMAKFPGIPGELLARHDMIWKYRNWTVAHSQSDLVMPLPVALLSGSTR